MNHDTQESERLILAQHYELLRYYSSRLFQAWTSAVTVYLLLWAIILKIGLQNGSVAATALGPAGETLVVAGGIALVTLIYLMAHGYYVKYLLVLRGGRSLEERLCSKEIHTKLFFSNYPRMAHWSVYAFQLVSVLVLGIYGMALTPSWWMLTLLIMLFTLILLSSIRIERFISRELTISQ